MLNKVRDVLIFIFNVKLMSFIFNIKMELCRMVGGAEQVARTGRILRPSYGSGPNVIIKENNTIHFCDSSSKMHNIKVKLIKILFI